MLYNPDYKNNIDIFTEAEKKELARITLPLADVTKTARVLEYEVFSLAYSSAKLENNTYTEEEAATLFATGITAQNKKASEAIMLVNLKNTIEYILRTEVDINQKSIMDIHRSLMVGLLEYQDVGVIRKTPVRVSIGSGELYYPPKDHIVLHNEMRAILEQQSHINNPFDRAVYNHCNIAYLQPFADGNKRVAKMLQCLTLSKAQVSPIFFRERDNTSYIKALITFYKTGDYKLYKHAFMEAYREQMKELRQVITPKIPSPSFRI